MDNRTYTIAGWTLAACVAALGLAITSNLIGAPHGEEKKGYPIEGVEEGGSEGGEAEMPIGTMMASADVARGQTVFAKCAACHTVTQGGANGIGPNLYGVMGEAIAAGRGGFAFSDALKGVGGNWDFERMNAWLTSPRRFASGTKMTFAGLSNPHDRADVIAYLNAQGSNLPLPAAPVQEAATPGAANASAAANAAAPEGNGAAPANVSDLANSAVPTVNSPNVDPNARIQAERKR